MILTSDWHLDDNPANEYRWEVFTHLKKILQQTGDREVYILGDLTEKKDKHSSALINRIVEELNNLVKHQKVNIVILKGNHDQPLMGPPYWDWLNLIDGVTFISKITISQEKLGLLLLPHTKNPLEDWKGGFSLRPSAIFMHQTLKGAVDNDRLLRGGVGISFPPGIKVYSGDVHTPQTIGNVVYVGSPHPVDFGDTYTCRMLQLDADYDIAQQFLLDTTKKSVIHIGSVAELDACGFRVGDKAKVRFLVKTADIGEWDSQQAAIKQWAAEHKVSLSVEPIPEESAGDLSILVSGTIQEQFHEYADGRGITGETKDFGFRLMEKYKQS